MGHGWRSLRTVIARRRGRQRGEARQVGCGRGRPCRRSTHALADAGAEPPPRLRLATSQARSREIPSRRCSAVILTHGRRRSPRRCVLGARPDLPPPAVLRRASDTTQVTAPVQAHAQSTSSHHPAPSASCATIFSVAAPSPMAQLVGLRPPHSSVGDTLFSVPTSSAHPWSRPRTRKLLTVAAAARAAGLGLSLHHAAVLATGPVKADGTLDGDLVDRRQRRPHHQSASSRTAGARARRRGQGRWPAQRRSKVDQRSSHSATTTPLPSQDLGLGMVVGRPRHRAMAPRSSALQYNENQVELLIGPALVAGQRAIVSVSPPGSGLAIDYQVVTAPAGADSRVSLERIPGTTVLTVRGQVAIGSPAIRETAAVPNPHHLLPERASRGVGAARHHRGRQHDRHRRCACEAGRGPDAAPRRSIGVAVGDCRHDQQVEPQPVRRDPAAVAVAGWCAGDYRGRPGGADRDTARLGHFPPTTTSPAMAPPVALRLPDPGRADRRADLHVAEP